MDQNVRLLRFENARRTGVEVDLPRTRPNRSIVSLVDECIRYWNAIRGQRPAPRREDFDPADIPQFLANVVLLEVVDGGSDFRFRVVGEAVRRASFGNHTGSLLTTLPHIAQDGPLLEALRDAVSSRAPVRNPVPYEGPRKEIVLSDHLALPFVGEDGEVSHLLLVVDLIDRRAGSRRLRAIPA